MMAPPMYRQRAACQVAVIWIDWYAYHLARFEGLQESFGACGEVVGIELVGGIGVHQGMSFREGVPENLPVETLLPNENWGDTSRLRLSRLLWKRLSQLKPQIVLVPGYYTLPAITAALWARTHGRVSVLMTESTQQDHDRSIYKEKLKSLLIRTLFGWAVCGGNAHVRYLRTLGFLSNRIAGYYNVVGNRTLSDGVDSVRRTSAAANYNLPEQYFLYVGRLAPEKNVHGLLRAWTAYRISGGTRPLVLVGDGELASSLKQAAKISGHHDDIYFVGHKSSRELLPYFAFAGAFVLPSIREPWGLVVNEAMAAGLPVFVSSRCGCAETLVENGRNGYVFDPTCEAELIDHLHRFDRLTPEEQDHMGQSSAKRIALYSPAAFGREILRIDQQTVRTKQTADRQKAGGS